MKRIKYLIIGSGVSGLSFANFIKGDYLIVDKEQEPGGLCRTIKKDGFIWDYAGHFFHFATEQLKSLFEKRINKDQFVSCKKNTKIYYKNQFIDYPFQKNIHQLEKEEFIDCLYDLYMKKEKAIYSNFEEMLYGKFGQGITEKFLKPYNEKLYACQLNLLDENAMGRFFPYAQIDEIIRNMKEKKDNSYNEAFLYPKYGAEVFVNALLEGIDKNKLALNTKVEEINLKDKVVRTAKEFIAYENLISTIPLNEFIKICGKQEESCKLEANKVLVYNLGFDQKSNITDIHWIYFPDKTINFYRVGFYDNILNTNRMSLYVEIGHRTEDEIDIEKEQKDTIRNLKKVGIIKDEKLISYAPVIINPGYVHIETISKEYVERVEKRLEKDNVFLQGRYGKWTYCSMEDAMFSAIKLAEKFNFENSNT